MECAYLQKSRNGSRVIYRKAVDPRLMPFITASTATTCYIGPRPSPSMLLDGCDVATSKPH